MSGGVKAFRRWRADHPEVSQMPLIGQRMYISCFDAGMAYGVAFANREARKSRANRKKPVDKPAPPVA